MPFKLREWSIVPGPAAIRPPFDSTELCDLEPVSAETAASAVLSLPDANLERAGEPEWWNWCSRWRYGGAEISIEMTIFETDPAQWGGFSLSGSASAHDLAALYREIHELLPTAWLHNESCELHSAESFVERYVHVT